jgi:hypothetical protein
MQNGSFCDKYFGNYAGDVCGSSCKIIADV